MNTILLDPLVLEGNTMIKLNRKQLVEYNNEILLGIYNLDVQLYLDVHCPSLRISIIFKGKLAPIFISLFS